MIIDCISDLHGFYPKLKGGDLLIVAGDLTAHDIKEEYASFIEWIDLSSLDYKKIILISGNHDNLIQKYGKEILSTFCEYLCDSGTEFKDLKIWGSPWTKSFEGMLMMQGQKEKCQPAIYQMFMRNKFGWDKENTVSHTIEPEVKKLLAFWEDEK